MENLSPLFALPWKRVFLFLTMMALSQSGEAFQNKCQREPPNTAVPKTAGDGGFKIKISGNPEKYVPGEVYTVSLQGKRSQYTVQKFSGFMLVVESASASDHYGPHSVGTFQLYGDVLTMHSEGCPNAIIQTSHILKSDIQILWTAPPSGSGCLRFKATLIEQRDVWYMDDGELTRDLCEEVQETDDMQPEVIYDCCACDEAKYEVTFEGLWSRQTHPKDFPANEWLTHFSDIIGASHSNEYRVWEYGGLSSDGLRQVAEWGSTRILESELKRQSDHIRTIIKARGLWYPNVNGKTFAVFRVDTKHHLMSLVSMLGPSPDWVVGVSALELCLRNCSWVSQKTLNLYPWDAGTDSGVTYMSANTPTIPRHKIRRITNSFPNDQKSPFYDPKGLPMKPLARITITRQRVYEKSCSDTGIIDHGDSYDVIEDEDDRPECATSEWSQFTPCSVSCGKGLRWRTRHYLIPMKADMWRCRRQLEEKEMCAARVPYCEGGSMNDIFGTSRYIFDNTICTTGEWSSWRPCSATCGKGESIRTRPYLNRMARKKCDEKLTESRSCMADVPECEDGNEEVDPSCPVTQWTNWSPCSVTCGEGVRQRTRYFVGPTARKNECNLKLIEKVVCEGERKDCTLSESEAKVVCLQGKQIGPCRGYYPRWYYDSERRMCMQFIYGGCKGNLNSFHKYDECTRMCEFARDKLHSDSNRNFQNNFNPHSSDTRSFAHGNPSTSYNYDDSSSSQGGGFGGLTPENQLGPPVDCMMTPWSDWTSCSVTCGTGWTETRRMVKVSAQNQGKPCPKKIVKRHKCKLPRCNKSNHNLESMSFKYDPYSEYTSPIMPSARQFHNLMPSPPRQAAPIESQEDLMREMDADRENTKEDCVMGDWGPWSPCSHSCGSESLQQRARSIVVKSRGGGIPCGPSLERRYCTLPPCLHPRG